jgi:hypothetical protein
VEGFLAESATQRDAAKQNITGRNRFRAAQQDATYRNKTQQHDHLQAAENPVVEHKETVERRWLRLALSVRMFSELTSGTDEALCLTIV